MLYENSDIYQHGSFVSVEIELYQNTVCFTGHTFLEELLNWLSFCVQAILIKTLNNSQLLNTNSKCNITGFANLDG